MSTEVIVAPSNHDEVTKCWSCISCCNVSCPCDRHLSCGEVNSQYTTPYRNRIDYFADSKREHKTNPHACFRHTLYSHHHQRGLQYIKDLNHHQQKPKTSDFTTNIIQEILLTSKCSTDMAMSYALMGNRLNNKPIGSELPIRQGTTSTICNLAGRSTKSNTQNSRVRLEDLVRPAMLLLGRQGTLPINQCSPTNPAGMTLPIGSIPRGDKIN
jgi:hypothetical protein